MWGLNQWTGMTTSWKVHTSYIQYKILYCYYCNKRPNHILSRYFNKIYFSFSSHRQTKCEYYFLCLRVCSRWEALALPTLIGVAQEKGSKCRKKICSNIGPRGIVIIKHSNISTERHVYINKWVLKKNIYKIHKNNTTYIFRLLCTSAESFVYKFVQCLC